MRRFFKFGPIEGLGGVLWALPAQNPDACCHTDRFGEELELVVSRGELPTEARGGGVETPGEARYAKTQRFP